MGVSIVKIPVWHHAPPGADEGVHVIDKGLCGRTDRQAGGEGTRERSRKRSEGASREICNAT